MRETSLTVADKLAFEVKLPYGNPKYRPTVQVHGPSGRASNCSYMLALLASEIDRAAVRNQCALKQEEPPRWISFLFTLLTAVPRP